MSDKNTELAKQRTQLAFIRTIAIFIGIFSMLIKKNYKIKILIVTVILLLIYGIYDIRYDTELYYIDITCIILIFCFITLVIK